MRPASARDFASWRAHARALLAEGVAPEQVAWDASGERSLFGAAPEPADAPRANVQRELASLLEAAACHADPARWALMYRALWRVVKGGERTLPADAADPDIARLSTMAKAVDREVHKMHAFVRFRESAGRDGNPVYDAWFEPEHDILRRAAPFFRDRFATLRWVIATPRGAARWDGEALEFVDTPLAKPPEGSDGKEDLWRTYYASIFNPARLNPTLMRQHMPQRYWKNLPEARDIAAMSRPREVLADPAPAPRWSQRVAFQPDTGGELDTCRRCPLWENATQAVPGKGLAAARIMLVGEQPGDEEDLKGEPFVGPAGKVLDQALAAAGIGRDAIFLTNAVKHFKWEPRGKRRIHKTPAQREVEACLAWLDQEIARVKPGVIVALGVTAAFALTGRKASIASLRGLTLEHASGASLVVTYHPSAILRGEDRAQGYLDALVDDLRRAAQLH